MATIPDPGTVLTGDSISSTTVRYSFPAPNDLWIQKLIEGMLFDLTSAFRFTQGGAVTPDQAARVFLDIWENITLYSQVGTIIEYAGIALPANALPCDGASYLRTDYPALFAIIGVLWGSTDSAHFNVPNLQGQALLGLGTAPSSTSYTITEQGGEETHTLTVPETPSHSHTDAPHNHVLSPHTHSEGNTIPIAVAPPVPPAVVPAALGSIGVTGPASDGIASSGVVIDSTGGDGSHENRQPFTVVNRGIIFA